MYVTISFTHIIESLPLFPLFIAPPQLRRFTPSAWPPVLLNICVPCSETQEFIISLEKEGFSTTYNIHHEERWYEYTRQAQEFNEASRCAWHHIYFTKMRGESKFNFQFQNDDSNESSADSDVDDFNDKNVKIIRICSRQDIYWSTGIS